MKKNIINKIVFVLFLIFSTITVFAQQVNTIYFMENVPIRHYLNPAFQPLSNFYFGFPVLGYTQFGVGNNSLTLKDFVYNKDGKTILFLNPEGNKDRFFNALHSKTSFRTDLQVNLLNFGFRTGTSYWSFSLSEKVDGELALPKELLKLLLYGTPAIENNVFDLRNLNVDMTAYTEAAFGYSKVIDDRWTAGGKLKLLFGTANISSSNQNLDLTAGMDQWTLKGKGSLNISTPGEVQIGKKLDSIEFIEPSSSAGWVKPSGMGLGLDLGVTFKPIDRMTLSAALTDLGFISWNRNVKNVNYEVDYTFDGFQSRNGSNVNDSIDGKELGDSLLTALKDATTNEQTGTSYTSYISPKLNIGAEYGFFDNKLSLGLLSRTTKHKKNYYEELTASVNGRPIDWFNMSLSYSILNGRMSNIGAGMGLRTGFVHWLISADYISFNNSRLPLNEMDANMPKITLPVPYNTKGIEFAIGVNFVFGNRKDADKDGVIDRKDKCPETPFGVFVDRIGCPVDTDGDSVPDYLDSCANTPVEAYTKIDDKGCPLDTDGDNVPDYLDECPDTPLEARGMIDTKGCPLDTDNDGVFDYLDLCPDTPAEAQGYLDKNGCPIDTDGDGVPDFHDKCPNTPLEARGMVNINGCPNDTDRDSVPDYMDDCPKLPGEITNKGCPEVKKEVRTLFQKALQGIQFETGKDLIRKSSFTILNQIAGVLMANPSYLIEVRGHTDNVGKTLSNQSLSERRALSVRTYLIEKGVDAKRITSNGFGDTQPVASNKTAAGRKQNRRVEFVVTFEEVHME